MKKAFAGLLILIVIAAVAYFAGPRVSVDQTIRFNADTIGDDPVAYLAASEAQIDGIHDNLEKQIVWAYPHSRAKTPLAVIYIHGFSASKEEIRPLPDLVAKELGANLFYARLKGHGRDGEALAGASVNDWINDFAEAMAIGTMIGERVLVMSTSTGGGLATWGASQARFARDIAGVILFSPNYAFRHPLAGLATGPWGRQIAELAEGETYSFVPSNEKHGRYWTAQYPTRAGLQMTALTKLARETQVGKIQVPALFIYSPSDTVVDAAVTQTVAERWGGPAETHVVKKSGDRNNHVIAGDVLSPDTTQPLTDIVIEWLRKII